MTNPLPYFPFGQQFDLRMGTSAFKADDRLIEVDQDYDHEISEKKKILDSDHRYYYRSAEGSDAAQWDVLKLLLENLVRFQPDLFKLEINGDEWQWHNGKTGEDFHFIYGKKDTLPFEPLDWAGRQVQEDLVILSNDDSATLIAGQLCFANGYSLGGLSACW